MFLSSYVLQSKADECDHSRGKLFRNAIAPSSTGTGVLGSMLASVGVVHMRTRAIANSHADNVHPCGDSHLLAETRSTSGPRCRRKRAGLVQWPTSWLQPCSLKVRHGSHGP